jgi:O-antigen ligase
MRWYRKPDRPETSVPTQVHQMIRPSVEKGMIVAAVIFFIACFIVPEVIYLYPILIIVLTVISFDRGLQFVFLTLGVNYALFWNNTNMALHPNAFITVGQIIFILIGLFKSRTIRVNNKSAWLLIFVFLSIASVFYAPSITDAIFVLATLILFALALVLFSTQFVSSVSHIFNLILLNGLILLSVVYPLQLLLTERPLFVNDIDRGLRFAAGGVHPVPLSFYFVLLMYASLHLYGQTKKLRYLLFTPIALVGSLLTQTRITYIGLVVTLFIFMYHKKKLRYLVPGSAAIIILLYDRIVSFFFKTNALYYQPTIAFITGGRINFWLQSWTYFTQHPYFGIGLGGTKVFLEATSGFSVPHNEYVRILTETGIFGFIPFIIFVVLQLETLVKKRQNALIILCLFIFFLIASFTDSLIDYNIYFTFPVFCLLGLVNVKSYQTEES